MRRSGFTLVELLVVVVILGLIAWLMMPNAKHAEQARLDMASRLLVADLEYAQLQSMGNGEDPCCVVFDLTKNEYFISRKTNPSEPMDDPATGGPFVTQFGRNRARWLEGVQVDGFDLGGDNELGYSADGALDQPDDAQVRLRLGSATKLVRINALTGEPQIID